MYEINSDHTLYSNSSEIQKPKAVVIFDHNLTIHDFRITCIITRKTSPTKNSKVTAKKSFPNSVTIKI